MSVLILRACGSPGRRGARASAATLDQACADGRRPTCPTTTQGRPLGPAACKQPCSPATRPCSRQAALQPCNPALQPCSPTWMSYRRPTAARMAALSARTSTMKTCARQGRAGAGVVSEEVAREARRTSWLRAASVALPGGCAQRHIASRATRSRLPRHTAPGAAAAWRRRPAPCCPLYCCGRSSPPPVACSPLQRSPPRRCSHAMLPPQLPRQL